MLPNRARICAAASEVSGPTAEGADTEASEVIETGAFSGVGVIAEDTSAGIGEEVSAAVGESAGTCTTAGAESGTTCAGAWIGVTEGFASFDKREARKIMKRAGSSFDATCRNFWEMPYT